MKKTIISIVVLLHLNQAFPSLSYQTLPPIPILPIPTAHQLSWQLSEMAMFFHFGPNTFTDSEWGTGHVHPSVFNPISLNTTQWVNVAKEAGFSRVILTAKHHDGFCLWPSEYTDYSVKSSPWKNGKGDIVSELAKSVAKIGDVQLGLYLSPWDRHEPVYGKTLEYNEYFLGQMTELLTKYGEIREIWLDGAKGEGEKYMEYFFDTWFNLIHQYQPKAIIFSDAGPDTRWIGNEEGVAQSTCWSLFNCSDAKIGGTPIEYSEKGDPFGHDWVPPECDVSIRPGWFWHASQSPKPAMTLLELYYNSVGRNCLFLLNVPPNSSGLISDEDIKVLKEFSTLRNTIFSNNLAKKARISASSTRGGVNDSRFSPSNLIKQGIYTYWAPGNLINPKNGAMNWTLYLVFQENVTFNVLEVQEPIQMGQRIMKFHLYILNAKGKWERVISGTTVGYKRLLKFVQVTSRKLRLIIEKSRAEPLISYLGIYVDPFSITPNIIHRTWSNHTNVI